MSRLRVYWPADRVEEPASARRDETHSQTDPAILSFVEAVRHRQQVRMPDVATRARSVYYNVNCPCCKRTAVVPLVLNDALRNRNRMPIPGTATLVGFHCNECRYEWPA